MSWAEELAREWSASTKPPRPDGHRMIEDGVDKLIELGIDGAIHAALEKAAQVAMGGACEGRTYQCLHSVCAGHREAVNSIRALMERHG